MPSHPIRDADGRVIGIACSRIRRGPKPLCSVCRKSPGTQLCDGPKPNGASKTCDAPLCRACAEHVGPDRDLCPPCAAEASP